MEQPHDRNPGPSTILLTIPLKKKSSIIAIIKVFDVITVDLLTRHAGLCQKFFRHPDTECAPLLRILEGLHSSSVTEPILALSTAHTPWPKTYSQLEYPNMSSFDGGKGFASS